MRLHRHLLAIASAVAVSEMARTVDAAGDRLDGPDLALPGFRGMTCTRVFEDGVPARELRCRSLRGWGLRRRTT